VLSLRAMPHDPWRRSDSVVVFALVVGLASSLAAIVGGYAAEHRWVPELGLSMFFVIVFAGALASELAELFRRRRESRR